MAKCAGGCQPLELRAEIFVTSTVTVQFSGSPETSTAYTNPRSTMFTKISGSTTVFNCCHKNSLSIMPQNFPNICLCDRVFVPREQIFYFHHAAIAFIFSAHNGEFGSTLRSYFKLRAEWNIVEALLH